MTRTVTLLGLAMAVLAGCGSTDTSATLINATTTPTPETAEATTTIVTQTDAVTVAQELEDAGLPITYDITDLTNVDSVLQENSEGLVSRAATATDDVDLTISVYETNAAAVADSERARTNIAAEDFEIIDERAICGTVVIDATIAFPEPADRANIPDVIDEAADLLEADYGPCDRLSLP